MMDLQRMICALAGTGALVGALALAVTFTTSAPVAASEITPRPVVAQSSLPQISTAPVTRSVSTYDLRPSDESAFQSAQVTSPPPAQQDHSAQGASGVGASAHADDDGAMRNMYIAMGAMTGYMFAAMPLTTATVTVAVGAGVATMWLYDVYLAPVPSM